MSADVDCVREVLGDVCGACVASDLRVPSALAALDRLAAAEAQRDTLADELRHAQATIGLAARYMTAKNFEAFINEAAALAAVAPAEEITA